MKLNALAVAAAAGLALTAAAMPADASPVAKSTSYSSYSSGNPAYPYTMTEIIPPKPLQGKPVYLHVTIPDPAVIGSLEVTTGVLHCSGCRDTILLQETRDTAYYLTYRLPPESSYSVNALTITFRSHRDYADRSLYPVLTLTSR
jgi:hypothetical protein